MFYAKQDGNLPVYNEVSPMLKFSMRSSDSDWVGGLISESEVPEKCLSQRGRVEDGVI